MRRTATLLLAALVALGACSRDRQQPAGQGETNRRASTLTIKGSDTLVMLAQRLAEAFMHKNPGLTVQVTGGGSGTGIAALINGTTELANSSRPIKDRERAHVKTTRGVEVVEHKVAIDAIAVYVSDDNPVKTIDLATLKKVFRGKIKNWKELGGPDMPIVLYSRENNSGTYAYFKEVVLDDEDFAAEAQTLPGTAAVIHAVARDRRGIGYGGIAFGEGVHTLEIADGEGPAYAPTLENATQGLYPLARFLFIYTAGEAGGPAQQYLEYVLSEAGQSVVEGVGYFPLPPEAETPDLPSNPD